MLLSGITGLGQTVLIVVAVSFIAWALVTAIFVPKRSPSFPRRLDAYILASVLLFVAQMTAVVWVTGTQAIEAEAHASGAEGGGAGEPTTTEPTTTEPTTTEPTTTEPSGGGGDATAGKDLFASNGCGSCHTLADAGASGSVGPNLDESKPTASLVADRVTNGKGGMPSFEGQLTEQQIQDVAAYVSTAAGA